MEVVVKDLQVYLKKKGRGVDSTVPFRLFGLEFNWFVSKLIFFW